MTVERHHLNGHKGFCNQCGIGIDERDDWHEFKKHDETGLTTEDIYICPKCLETTSMVWKYKEHTKELEKQNEQLAPMIEGMAKTVRKLADFKYLLDWACKQDSPINDYKADG